MSDDERFQQFKSLHNLTSVPSINCACRLRTERPGSSHLRCTPPKPFGDHIHGFRDSNLSPVLVCSPYYKIGRTPEQAAKYLAELRKLATLWADTWNLGVRFEDTSYYHEAATLVMFYRKLPLNQFDINQILRRKKTADRVRSRK